MEARPVAERDLTASPPRVALTIPSLAGGGAERVLAMLANHWADAGCDVTLITLDAAHADRHKLDPRIARVGLDLVRHSRGPWHGLANNVRRLRALRRALRSCGPDAIVSFLDQMNVLTLLAARGLAAPVIIAERTNPQQHQLGRIWSLLRRAVYPRCSALVVQTRRAQEQMRAVVPNRPIWVIPNGVATPAGSGPMESERREPAIVGMGRLSPEKGFDLLIEAFARVAPRHPDWTLVVLGEGPQRAELEQRIRRHGLETRVRLPGWTSEPQLILRTSGIFVLPSRYEGFPNALLEAMAWGLPAISFDCPNGPAEIIRHGVDGLLVPPGDVPALASALDRLMSDNAERQRLGTATAEVTERFSLRTFFERWGAVVLTPTIDSPK